MNAKSIKPPASIDDTLTLLAQADYLADRSLATVLFLALRMGRPLFLEGEAGVGKTEIAKVLSATLGRRLIRLQCYEGLDVSAAVYEWNYAEQMIAIRLAEAAGSVDRECQRLALRSLLVLLELFQERVIPRQAVDDGHHLAAPPLLLHAQLRDDARGDRLAGVPAAALAVGVGPATPRRCRRIR